MTQEEQDIEWVVNWFPQEVVSVVPAPNFFQVHSVQIVGEGGDQFILSVATQGRYPGVEGKILELVQAGEKRDLGKCAHSRQQHEF